ncbi:retrotransposon protein, putative, ty1-copia subclass [Tanacetum coccineum]
MDDIVHTYKAHLIGKGYTQTYGVDYDETFSPVADIRAIRFLISISTFYDYEIWQIDVNTAFLNGYLDEDIYIEQPEDKILKRFRMDTSKRAYIPMKERLDLNKTQGASTPEEVKRMQNVPYASAVGSIMYAVRCTRPDVTITKDMFLVYGGNPEAEHRVDCYCNAGFETDRDDIKSQTRYVFILNGGAVDWKSSKQSTTAMSATETEYKAASEAAMKAVWFKKFISKLDNSFADPFTMALSKGKLTQHTRSMGLRLASSFI